MKTRFPWGETELELDLPDEWRIVAHAQPNGYAACASVEQEFGRAASKPAGAEALRNRNLRGKKVVLVVDDLTRPTPVHLFFPFLLREMEAAGAQRSDLSLITALGVHRPMSETELEKKIGREGLRDLHWENHKAHDAAGLVFLGKTRAGTEVLVNGRLAEADLIIALGSIEPHVLAGFGGGLKNIVPGCAGALTIGKNHFCGAMEGPLAQIGVEPEANPLRRDLEEAALLLRKEIFLVNTVLNPQQEIVKVFAGDPIRAHREGIELARTIYGVPVPEPADIIITDSSPMDTDLRQGAKCIGNLLAAVKEKGTILALLRCREGLGDFKLSGHSLPRPVMRALVRVMSRRKTLAFLDTFRRDLAVEERFLAFYGLQVLRRNEILAYAPSVEPEQARRLGLFKVFRDPQDLVRLAARRAPRRPTVGIFPQGGVTFPMVGDEVTAPPGV